MVTPAPTLIPLPILISEVFPKPSQGEEWVELYNPNTTAIHLSGWELWDELSQPSLIFSFTTQTIESNQWLIVPINKKLNDTEDGVTLETNTGQISDAMRYVSSEPDKSWARQGTSPNSTWNLGAASPGASNPTPTQTPTPTAQPTSSPTPEPTQTTTPSKTPTPSPIGVPTQNPTLAVAAAQKIFNPPAQVSFATTSPAPVAPTQIPLTPSLIPTLSLEKPPSAASEEKIKNPKLPALYYIGLLLIQLSSIGMVLSKQGMIKPDAVAPIH